MLQTMLALAFLAPMPAQENNLLSLLPSYSTQQRLLSNLESQLCLAREQAAKNCRTWDERWNEANRDNASLDTLLTIQWQKIQELERDWQLLVDLTHRWEQEYQRHPCPSVVREGFYVQHKQIYQWRVGARQFLYGMLVNYKWSWEGDEDHLNNDCVDGLAHLLGYHKSGDLLRHVANVETVVTDLRPFLRW
jgi:hypothetical protein